MGFTSRNISEPILWPEKPRSGPKLGLMPFRTLCTPVCLWAAWVVCLMATRERVLLFLGSVCWGPKPWPSEPVCCIPSPLDLITLARYRSWADRPISLEIFTLAWAPVVLSGPEWRPKQKPILGSLCLTECWVVASSSFSATWVTMNNAAMWPQASVVFILMWGHQAGHFIWGLGHGEAVRVMCFQGMSVSHWT